MIKEFQIRLLPQHAHSEQSIIEYLAKEKGMDARTVKHVRVLKRSVDARQRTVYVNLSLRVYIGCVPNAARHRGGSWPCGTFCRTSFD